MTSLIALMEVARSSETLVNFYQTTRRYNLEDSHLRTNHRENLISYLKYSWVISHISSEQLLQINKADHLEKFNHESL
jgi:hypothetical protein